MLVIQKSEAYLIHLIHMVLDILLCTWCILPLQVIRGHMFVTYLSGNITVKYLSFKHLLSHQISYAKCVCLREQRYVFWGRHIVFVLSICLLQNFVCTTLPAFYVGISQNVLAYYHMKIHLS